MNKIAKIAKFLHRFATDNYPEEFYTVAAEQLIAELDAPVDPKRDWLAVNQDTPIGTLCWTSQEHARVELLREYRKDDPTGFEYWYKTLNSSRYAERFLGIQLLDNPGLDAPPCEGLVLVVFDTQEIELWNVPEYFVGNWKTKPPGLPAKIIRQWAPVKWVEGRLVVDIDRLRSES